MFVIIGIVIVLAAVVGGFLLEGGNLHVIIQPVEVLIIFGAALGGFLISSPMSVVKGTISQLLKIFSAKEPDRKTYLSILVVLFDLLTIVRREGLVAIEKHLESPPKSPIFSKHPAVVNNHELRDFICDNFKVFMSANMEPHEFDHLMEVDMDAIHHEAMVVPAAVRKVSDALPGLGIVAAVLGVVLTMGKIKEPPEVLGHSIGAALVGTFLGILGCYGFMGPMAQNLDYQAKAMNSQLNVVRTALMAFALGMPPPVAAESGRRAIPANHRPSFVELEAALKGARKK